MKTTNLTIGDFPSVESGEWKKELLIAWSGGADSTAIIHQALHKGYSVSTVGINHPQIIASTPQKYARSQILKLLQLEFGNERIHHVEITLPDLEISDTGGCPQAALWASIVPLIITREQDLVFGYIRQDDIWHYKESLERGIHALSKVKDSIISIRYPLEWNYKIEILQYLRHYELDQLIYYCQNIVPDINMRCCNSCKTVLVSSMLHNFTIQHSMAQFKDK